MNMITKLLHHPDLGLLALRLIIGFVGVLHGGQKFGLFGGPGIEAFAEVLTSLNVPQPTAAAYAAAISELGGGVLIALGILPRFAAIPFLFTMLVAFIHAHGAKVTGEGSGEFALVLAVVLFSLILTGPGKLTVVGAKWAQRPAAPAPAAAS